MAKAKAAEATTGTDVVIFQEAEAMTAKATADLVTTTIGTEEALAALKQTYGELVVNGIEDMAGYKVVVEGVSKLRTIRTSIEKRRKELTEPALEFQRRLKAEADRLTGEIVPLEERLKAEKARIDDAKEAARRAEFQRRVTLLTENAWTLAGGFYVCGALQIHPDQITTMTEQELEFYVNEGQREIERREAEAKRKAEEEAQRKAEEERIRQERAAIEAERAELARMKAELDAQKKALETSYETVVQPVQNAQPAATVNAELAQPEPKQMVAAAVPGGGTVSMEHQQPARGASVVPSQKAPQLTYGPAYMMGFDNFRLQLIELLSGEQKYTRAQIIDWAKDLTPRN